MKQNERRTALTLWQRFLAPTPKKYWIFGTVCQLLSIIAFIIYLFGNISIFLYVGFIFLFIAIGFHCEVDYFALALKDFEQKIHKLGGVPVFRNPPPPPPPIKSENDIVFEDVLKNASVEMLLSEN